jgi:hypothetical protein
MDNVIVTSKGQVVIPAKYRRKFNIMISRVLDSYSLIAYLDSLVRFSGKAQTFPTGLGRKRNNTGDGIWSRMK